MKKAKIIMLITGILLAGCSNTKSGESQQEVKYINCKRTDYYDAMEVVTNIKINYQGVEALSTDTKETIHLYKPEGASEEELVTFVDELLKSYDLKVAAAKEDKAITFQYQYKDSTIITKGTIDYTKVNIETLLKDDPELEVLLEDGKVHVSKLKANYEAIGAICTDFE